MKHLLIATAIAIGTIIDRPGQNFTFIPNPVKMYSLQIELGNRVFRGILEYRSKVTLQGGFGIIQLNSPISQKPVPPNTEPAQPVLPGGGQNRPDPPRTPPSNQTEPGGGLDTTDSTCPTTEKQLRALIPVTNPVLTTSETPTLLFYVPYGSQQVRQGEFSVLTRDEKSRIYKIQFTLPETPGIVSVTLPESSESLLAQDTYYHWYFKLYCQENSSPRPDLELNGWIQRVELTPERQRQIDEATADVWYDSLANLAKLILDSPQDQELREKWRELLNSIEAENLASESLNGEVIFLEE